MDMESTRRPFDRSISKEPGLKKPRLIEDPAASDRNSVASNRTSGGGGFIRRPASSNSAIAGGSRFQRDSESSDSVRGSYQHQQSPQLHQELVTQYKTALAELTFNSKPIITNLTIIAGENVHAAKAIAATVCTNILEVPTEQKLPSLYLLDSIVKNIGRDYIKHFASRLPEVFCKAYRQVDPSVHPGMRHLFGTWKGVFPPQPLQMIENELGLATAANGSTSGTTTARQGSQSQRHSHSIHVNPKYLEARQHLEQSTRVRGAANDVNETLMNLPEDAEVPERTSSNLGRTWTNPHVKNIQWPCKDQVNEPARDRNLSVAYGDSDNGSNPSKRSGLGVGRASEKLQELGFDKPLHESGSDVTGIIFNSKNGLDMKHGVQSYSVHKSINPDSHLELNHKFTGRSSSGTTRNWNMNSRPTDNDAVGSLAKFSQWMPDEFETDFENHVQRPKNMHGIGPRVDDEASTDSLSAYPGQVAPGVQMSSSWSQEMQPLERRLSGPVRNISGHAQVNHTALSSSANSLDRTSFQSQIGPGISGAPSFSFSTNAMLGSTVSITQQNLEAGSQSPMLQRPPSPLFSSRNPNQLLHNFAEHNQSSNLHRLDPRRPQFSGQINAGPHSQFPQDSLSVPSEDVRLASSSRLHLQNLQTLSTVVPSQQKNHGPPKQQKKFELSDSESSGEGQKPSPLQIPGVETCSTMGKSSPYQSNSLTAHYPGQSNTGSLLATVVKSEPSSSEPSFKGAGGGFPQAGVQPPLPSGLPPTNLASFPPLHGSTVVPSFSQGKEEWPPLPSGPPPSSLTGHSSEQTPSAVNSASNPVTSLLSSLVARGLISASKTDSPTLAPSQIPSRSPDLGTGIASTISNPVSSVSVSIGKPLSSTTDELPSIRPDAKICEGLPQSTTTKISNLIGFEFRPGIIRDSHPAVISQLLDNLPHKCSICGLRLKLQERFDKHMEWHASRVPEQNSLSTTSRSWYASSVDWVAGIAPLQPFEGAADLLGSESSEPMVPVDESQCACVLCGELFEDFYSLERGEWMFKGAVYVTSPSLQGRTGTTSDSASVSLIVHASCTSDDSVCDLGLVRDIKLEKDS